MVRTSEQLVNGINEALRHPEKRSVGRRVIRDTEAGPNPGQAGRKIAEVILGL